MLHVGAVHLTSHSSFCEQLLVFSKLFTWVAALDGGRLVVNSTYIIFSNRTFVACNEEELEQFFLTLKTVLES